MARSGWGSMTDQFAIAKDGPRGANTARALSSSSPPSHASTFTPTPHQQMARCGRHSYEAAIKACDEEHDWMNLGQVMSRLIMRTVPCGTAHAADRDFVLIVIGVISPCRGQRLHDGDFPCMSSRAAPGHRACARGVSGGLRFRPASSACTRSAESCWSTAAPPRRFTMWRVPRTLP